MTARHDICAVCLATFERPRRGSGKRYCSPKCRKRAELDKRKAAKAVELEALPDGAIVDRRGRRCVIARGHVLADATGVADSRKLAAFDRLGGTAGCELCGTDEVAWCDGSLWWRSVGCHLVAVCRTCSAAVSVLGTLGIDPTPVLRGLTGLVLPPHLRWGGSNPAPVRPDEGTTAAVDLVALARLGARLLPSVQAPGTSAAEVVAAVLVAHQWGDVLTGEEV